ncbi:MAG TPA: hypothetical protein VEK08_23570 [Planctomycetota bacterium]|nr:hypothetical protein [Planctomycetota bacterium]
MYASLPDRQPRNGNLLLLGIAVFAGIVILFHLMGLSVLQSDPFDYLEQSREWWRVDDHMPGFAALIWCVNLLTFGLLPSSVLLQASAILCWGVSVYYVDKILSTLYPSASHWGVALYALFPFVGVTYAAWPIGDYMAHAAIAYCFYCMLQKRWTALTIGLAFSLLIHKAIWPFAFLIAVAGWWRHGYPLWMFIASGVPLLAFWTAGVIKSGDPLWIIKIDLTRHLPSHSPLPILDGVIGTLLQGGARGLVKGGFLLTVLLGTLYMTYVFIRRRSWEMLALVLPIVALLMTMNQWEAWASIRYAKIMALPLVAALSTTRLFMMLNARQWLFGTFVALLVASQLAFAMYIEKYFDEETGYVHERRAAEKAANIKYESAIGTDKR